MENKAIQVDEIMDACLLAGKIMLQSGAETYRVEDTMIRIAASFGIEETHSYVTPTGIFLSVESMGQIKTRVIRIVERSTDLKKVTLVNSLSRKISDGEIQLHDVLSHLKEIDSLDIAFPLKLQVAAASIASGCFLIMFNGAWNDFIPAMISGGVGYLSFIWVHRFVPIRFFSEFLASFIIGLLSLFFVKMGWGHGLDKIIISSLMSLVPGLLITNALRDLIAGHLVSGMSKGAEAFLTAFAIGSGIAVVLSFL